MLCTNIFVAFHKLAQKHETQFDLLHGKYHIILT